MAFFPTNTGGLFDGMNIFGARQPDYLGGILSPEELQKVQNQSLLQGVLGTAATYLAQPKNQGYGSALPYLGKAYLGVFVKVRFGSISEYLLSIASLTLLTASYPTVPSGSF